MPRSPLAADIEMWKWIPGKKGKHNYEAGLSSASSGSTSYAMSPHAFSISSPTPCRTCGRMSRWTCANGIGTGPPHCRGPTHNSQTAGISTQIGCPCRRSWRAVAPVCCRSTAGASTCHQISSTSQGTLSTPPMMTPGSGTSTTCGGRRSLSVMLQSHHGCALPQAVRVPPGRASARAYAHALPLAVPATTTSNHDHRRGGGASEEGARGLREGV